MEDHPTEDELTRQASQVRLRELSHLERSERGLANAYRSAHGLRGIPDHQLAELGQRHRSHAELLRARIIALGGVPDDDPEDVWVSGLDAAALRFAEHLSTATYHDHLIDLDEPTAEVIEQVILPDHVSAMALLDPMYEPDRDGDL